MQKYIYRLTFIENFSYRSEDFETQVPPNMWADKEKVVYKIILLCNKKLRNLEVFYSLVLKSIVKSKVNQEEKTHAGWPHSYMAYNKTKQNCQSMKIKADIINRIIYLRLQRGRGRGSLGQKQ